MKGYEILVNAIDALFKVLNLFVPALLLFYMVNYFALKRKKVKTIVILSVLEFVSIIFYIIEMQTGFFGLYKPMFAAEILLIIFMLIVNNIVYMIIMAKTNKDKFKPFKKVILILIAPIITIVIFLLWFLVQNSILS